MSDAKQTAGQANNYRMEIVQRDQSERDMKEKIRILESEIDQVWKQKYLNNFIDNPFSAKGEFD